MTKTKLIATATGTLTLLLAIFAFVLSFNALSDLAAQHGISIPFLFPFVVEAGVVVFSLNALYRSLTGQRATWQWTLIILSSLLAGTFNVAHADADILSQTMAAMPSLFLLLSFESFLSLIKFGVKRQSTIVTLDSLVSQLADKQKQFDDKMAELDKSASDKEAELDRLDGQIDKARQTLVSLQNDIKEVKTTTKRRNVEEMIEAKRSKVDDRRQEVLSMLQSGLAEDVIADQLDVSIRTIQRDIKSLNGQVMTK